MTQAHETGLAGTTVPVTADGAVSLSDGCRAPPQADLSDDALRRLDEIWPGPGGEAPQSYAW